MSAFCQTSFDNARKKARKSYATENDSLIFHAKKTTDLAQGTEEKRRAFDLLGFYSGYLGYTKLSIDSYKKAMHFSTTQEQKHRQYLNIGIGLQQALGSNKKSKLTADSCIKVFRKLNNKKLLSYSYDLKANILLSQNKKSSINWFRKSMAAKSQSEVGYSHYQIGKAFSRFGNLDSAVHYQRLAIKTFPIKTADYRLKMRATLAKYLVTLGKKNSLDWLKKANSYKSASEITKAELSCIWALYHFKFGNPKEALKSLDNMDGSLFVAVDVATNSVDRKARHIAAIGLYEDILSSNAPDVIKTRYRTKIEVSKAYIEGLKNGLQKGSIESNLIAEIFPNQVQPGTPIFTWIFGGILLVLLVWYAAKGKDNIFQVVPEPVVTEEQTVITRVEGYTGKLSKENKEIILLISEGKSTKEIAEMKGIKFDTLRKRLWRFAKRAGKTDIRDLF